MLLAMLVAAAVSFASTPMVKTLACKVGAIDVPKDNRRMHKVPIPRMGGLAIFLAFLLSVLVFADIDRQMQGILLGSIMIVILGVLDDIMALKALPKLFVQIAAAGVAVWHGCTIQFVSNPNVFSEATYRCVCHLDRVLDRRGAHGEGGQHRHHPLCALRRMPRLYPV